jgi:starch synthase
LQIAFVTPELQTLVRRTNLAGVAESLALALRAAGPEVRVFLPWTLETEVDALGELVPRGSVRVPDGNLAQTFDVYEGRLGDLRVHLFENEPFFGSRQPYGGPEGPYPDNWRRYVLFSRAVLASFEQLDFQPEVLHCLDWSTGFLPLLHRREWVEQRPDHPTSQAGTYFAIHNLAMQGVFEREILAHIGIPHQYFRNIEGVELGGKVNFLKTGAEFATIIGTHSPRHALKIQERDRGYGLEDTFRRRKKELIGINNGIDVTAWNPAQDPALPAAFGVDEKLFNGKKKCKAVLQSSLKLDAGPRTPILCSIGRWDADGGFDLLVEVLTDILERNVEVVLMGQGSPEMVQRLQTLEGAFVGRLRVIEGYNPHTAHLLMGGSDLQLLLSHYQPSNPLFAIGMRYGVVPLVYGKSGLEDAVIDANTDRKHSTGFHFATYTNEGLIEGVNQALELYRSPNAWKMLVKRCMNQDFSWQATAAEYLKAYRRVTRRAKMGLESA